MTEYVPLSAKRVDTASKISGEDIPALLSKAFHNWSNMVTGSDESYGGVCTYEDGRSKILVASPEKYLAQAGILALEIDGSDPIWVHASVEALSEMAGLTNIDLAKFHFVGVVTPYEKIISAARHPGVALLFDQENCRQEYEEGINFHSLHNGLGSKLGPKRVDTTVYRVDPEVLQKIDKRKIKLRKPAIADTDRMSTLGAILQEQSGISLKASGYRHSTSHSVTTLLPEKIRGDINRRPVDTITLIDSVVAHSLLGI